MWNNEDPDLVARAQGELPYRLSAYESLVVRCYPRVRKLALGIVGAPDAADTVAQDVMLRMMHGLPKLEDPARFNPWLRQITVNTSRTHIAREKTEREKRAAYVSVAEASEPLDEGPQTASYAELISALDAEERTIVSLKVLEDLEFQEIAAILDLQLSATKMRYYRALERLKAQHAEPR